MGGGEEEGEEGDPQDEGRPVRGCWLSLPRSLGRAVTAVPPLYRRPQEDRDKVAARGPVPPRRLTEKAGRGRGGARDKGGKLCACMWRLGWGRGRAPHVRLTCRLPPGFPPPPRREPPPPPLRNASQPIGGAATPPSLCAVTCASPGKRPWRAGARRRREAVVGSRRVRRQRLSSPWGDAPAGWGRPFLRPRPGRLRGRGSVLSRRRRWRL